MRGLIILLLLMPVAQAQVYKWVDDNGKIHYSDEKPQGQQVLEEEVEIKNSQLQIMGEKDNRLLESFEADREKREAQHEQEEGASDKRDSPTESEMSEQNTPLKRHECFGPSPSSTPSGVSYLDVNTRELDTDQIRNLKQIFDEIRGRWKGVAEGFSCLGTVQNLQKKPENFSVRAEATVDSSSTLYLLADLDSQDTGVRRNERYEFYLKDSLLRLDSESAAGDIELLHLTESGFTVLQKRWHGIGRRRNNFVETLIAVNRAEDSLTIERVNYANGMLGGVSIWMLEKY